MAIASAGGRRRADAFVGRERELDELLARLEQSLNGRGQLVAITGAAGVGKTRLARELAADAADRKARVVWGHCREEGGEALELWMQVLRRIAGVERVREAEQIPRAGLFAVVADLFRAVTRHEPVVLILEDLHWADTASLRLLDSLSAELLDLPLFAILTWRAAPSPPERAVGKLIEGLVRHGHRLALRGLGREALAETVRQNFGIELSEAWLDELQRRTEGNPFFVDEMVRLLRSEGLLEAPVPSDLPLPPGVRETVLRQVRALSPAAQSVLHAASVIGREFGIGALSAACDLDRAAIGERLHEASMCGLVSEPTTSLGVYAFTHALVGEALYAELEPAARERLHGRVGEALEAFHGESRQLHLAEIANHLLLAPPAEGDRRALEYARRAAAEAYERCAFGEAAALYERALSRLAAVGGSTVERCELLLALSTSQARRGRMREAASACDEALSAARALGDPELVARAVVTLAENTWRTGYVNSSEAVAPLERALAEIGPERRAERAHVLGALAQTLVRIPFELPRALGLARESVAAARDAGAGPTGSALLGLRAALPWSDDLAEGVALTDRLLDLAREAQDRELEFNAQTLKLHEALMWGQGAEADQRLVAIRQLSGQLQQPFYRALAAVWGICLESTRGRLDEADRLIGEVMASAGEADLEPDLHGWAVVQVFQQRGRLAEIEPAVQALVDEPQNAAARLISANLVYVEDERREDARVALERWPEEEESCLRPDQRRSLAELCCLAATYALLGDAHRADRLYVRLRPFADRCAVSASTPAYWFGSVEHYLGLLARTKGRLDDAEAHLRRAIPVQVRMRSPYWIARSRLALADVLLARSDEEARREARVLVGQAEVAARSLDGDGLDAWLERGRRALGNDSPPPKEAAAESSSASLDRATFRWSGEHWLVGFGDDTAAFRSSKGMHVLHYLLAHPDREFHVLDLVPVAEGGPAGDAEAVPAEGDAGELLDAEAKAAYRARLEALREVEREAEVRSDARAVAAAQEEIHVLARELARAVGLGGRGRRAASNVERARVNLARTIRAALRRLATRDRALGGHLERAIRTGTFCAYEPDPSHPVRWLL